MKTFLSAPRGAAVSLSIALLSAIQPASALSMRTYVSTPSQWGTGSAFYHGHTVMASTPYNVLNAGGGFTVQCNHPAVLMMTGERGLGSNTYGIDPNKPTAVFVGRITRQKGVVHLLEAAQHFDPSIQLVLCAGAPDTPEIGKEVADMVANLQARREGVIWISEMLARPDIIRILSSSTLFVCPSIYEPFGIVNVEAMGCGVAVVASAVGGIPVGPGMPIGRADQEASLARAAVAPIAEQPGEIFGSQGVPTLVENHGASR